jgi:hypothetical protein
MKELKIETAEWQAKDGRTCYGLMITKPNGKNPYINYVYGSEKARQSYIEQEKRSFQSHLDLVARRKENRQAKRLQLKEGDILYTSWGYDQTNIDWYQVVSLYGKYGVILREISASVTETGFMSGESMPVKDDFVGEPMRKIISGDYITIDESRTAFLWNGRPKYKSWYA